MESRCIIEDINRLDMQDSICQRVTSYVIKEHGQGLSCMVWQCNMAEFTSMTVKLPTALQVQIDHLGIIKEIELLENFKGSQGLPCSGAYLNRRLKEVVLNTSLYDTGYFLHRKLNCDCRHVNELLCGLSALLAQEEIKNKKECSVYNVSCAKETPTGIMITDEIIVNDLHSISYMDFEFDKSKIEFGKDGGLKKIPKMTLHTELVHGKSRQIYDSVLEDAGTRQALVMSFIKMMHTTWKNIGKSLGVRRNFCFSNLYPTSFYGLFVQCLALILYPGNFNYFQHSVKGLQRVQGQPLCIGMVETIDEAEQCFPSFGVEDLYEM